MTPFFFLFVTPFFLTPFFAFFRAKSAQSRAIKRTGQPDDVLGLWVFPASPESDFITGQTIVVDGGGVMH